MNRRAAALFPSWIGLVSGLILGLGCLWAGHATANVGNPYREGDLAGDPLMLDSTRVVAERLAFDTLGLRDGEDRELVRIDVRYELQHDGDRKRVRPVFMAAGRNMRDFKAALDGKPVPVEHLQNFALPDPAWGVPKTSSETDARGWEEPRQSIEHALALDFELTPGAHTLTVSYIIAPGVHRNRGPTLEYSFDYILAPARTWAGFRDLSVSLKAPEGWTMTSTPPLQRGTLPNRSGDEYSAHFAELPANVIRFAVQAQPSVAYWVAYVGTRLCFLIALVCGLFVIVNIARRHASKFGLADGQGGTTQRVSPLWWVMLYCGCGWALTILLSWFVASEWPARFLPSGQEAQYGYGPALMWVLVFALAALSLPTAALAVWTTNRKARLRSGE